MRKQRDRISRDIADMNAKKSRIISEKEIKVKRPK